MKYCFYEKLLIFLWTAMVLLFGFLNQLTTDWHWNIQILFVFDRNGLDGLIYGSWIACNQFGQVGNHHVRSRLGCDDYKRSAWNGVQSWIQQFLFCLAFDYAIFVHIAGKFWTYIGINSSSLSRRYLTHNCAKALIDSNIWIKINSYDSIGIFGSAEIFRPYSIWLD